MLVSQEPPSGGWGPSCRGAAPPDFQRRKRTYARRPYRLKRGSKNARRRKLSWRWKTRITSEEGSHAAHGDEIYSNFHWGAH